MTIYIYIHISGAQTVDTREHKQWTLQITNSGHNKCYAQTMDTPDHKQWTLQITYMYIHPINDNIYIYIYTSREHKQWTLGSTSSGHSRSQTVDTPEYILMHTPNK